MTKSIDNRNLAVMILCFILGGFNLIISILTINVAITFNNNSSSTLFNLLDSIIPNAKYFIISSISFITLINSVVFIIAGVCIFYLTNDKERKNVESKITEQLLTNDEKEMIEVIKKNKGAITQKEITNLLDFPKARVSRVITKLEQKGLIKKVKYGMTNKILLIH